MAHVPSKGTWASRNAIIKMPVDIMKGIDKATASSMASQMGFTGAQNADAEKLIGVIQWSTSTNLPDLDPGMCFNK